MSATTLRRKPVDIKAWHLVDAPGPTGETVQVQFIMMEALTALMAEGWRGAPVHTPDGWRLELNSDAMEPIIATAGQWVVIDGGVRVLSDADVQAGYTVA